MIQISNSLQLAPGTLVLLVGPAGSGKSTWAEAHFKPSQIISSDAYREIVSDDASDQGASKDAFELLHRTVEMRLARRLFTVVDATNLTPKARRPLVDIAQAAGVQVAAVVLDVPENDALLQNRRRPRKVPDDVIQRHYTQLRDTLKSIVHERFDVVYQIDPKCAQANVRKSTRPDAPSYHIIGDIHGCAGELEMLIQRLGYRWQVGPDTVLRLEHPDGCALRFVGDYIDRGPDSMGVLALVADILLYPGSPHGGVLGNHDDKFRRYLYGRKVKPKHGLERTIADYEALALEQKARIRYLLDSLPYQLVNGCTGRADLVVAHAGLPADKIMDGTAKTEAFCLYGDVRGHDGTYPIRDTGWCKDWATIGPMLVYGHTVFKDGPIREGNSINIDTGCVFGGALTAYHYPSGTVTREPSMCEYAPLNPR